MFFFFNGLVFEPSCRHRSASVASGVYWRLGEHCFKQEKRADGLSVFLFFCDAEWWVASHAVAPGLQSKWLARACVPPGRRYTELSRLEWHCPYWEQETQPSLWAKSIHSLREESDTKHADKSITLCEQHESILKSKQVEFDTLNAAYESLQKEFLDLTVKPKGFMHTPIGQPPLKPKTGWFNKMLALIVALQTAETDVVERLIAECLAWCQTVGLLVVFVVA